MVGAAAAASSLATELGRLAAVRLGIMALTPPQQAATAAFCDARDVVVLWPTGAGKSLCFQLAALWRRQQGLGPTVVICPLIALMDDQVGGLRARGVAAAAWHSGQPPAQQRATQAQLVKGELDLLYVAAERATLPAFVHALQVAQIAALAVDEAHCICEWGHDFRPDYRRLGELRRRLGVPTIALSASATPAARRDLAQNLGLQAPQFFIRSTQRQNLRFAVQPLPRKQIAAGRWAALLAALGRWPGSGQVVVYTTSRAQAARLAQQLDAAGHPAACYHAGLAPTVRRDALLPFVAGTVPILCATSAFGMGVDLPGIRLVVHYSAPASLEAYYQEAGRAGRDGAAADCLLLWHPGDLAALARRSGGAAAGAAARRLGLQAYVDGGRCRQLQVAAYFGVEALQPAACGGCDRCLRPPAALRPAAVDAPPPPLGALAQEAVLRMVAALRRPVGARLLTAALRGSRAQVLRRFGLLTAPDHGALRQLPEVQVRAGLASMLVAGQLAPRGRKHPTLWLPNRPVRAAGSAAGRVAGRRAPPPPPSLQAALRRFVRQAAKELGWPPYKVLPKRTVAQIVAEQPRSAVALAQIHGIGPQRQARFGAQLLALVAAYAGGKPAPFFAPP